MNLRSQIVVAEEEDTLDAGSVYRRLEAKMIAPPPKPLRGRGRQAWEALKASERRDGEPLLSGLAKGLDP